jgi:hypothetical protein
MTEVLRRDFLAGLAASVTAARGLNTSDVSTVPPATDRSAPEPAEHPGSAAPPESHAVDFRYSPRHWQTTMCFPDDAHKSIVGQLGDLRYGFAKALLVGMEDFSTVCTFSLAGMQEDRVVRQWLESPSVPIVHTLIDRPTAEFELAAFATRREDEGRVDNVLLTIRAKGKSVAAIPKIHVRTCDPLTISAKGQLLVASKSDSGTLFFVGGKVADTVGTPVWWDEAGYTLYLAPGEATPENSLRYLMRFPLSGQPVASLLTPFENPDELLSEVRRWWAAWRPFGDVHWNYPSHHGKFLTACARNIQQARELKNDRLVFQVGPTVYRGLWIVDGNFLLEAARYLGYDQEADQGLRSEWSKQLPTGQVVAAVPGEHWKDTAIAMFTLVRQCELKQDWSDFRELEPNVRRAIDFLRATRDEASKGDSTNGKYGLLAPGFADGGINGVRSEFTNTVWTLAGLKAVASASARLNMNSLSGADTLYQQLRGAFQDAARREMVKHPEGFEYLPMLARDDSAYRNPDPWNRPRPQSAQWALSHAIFPGGVFAPDDPVVKGHIALLQSCTREDIPAETGWLWHEAVWNYNASFAAHIYLWAGLHSWAARTFAGFLNHASPLFCWREEQPLQHALVGQDWGDMPHNWASAECIRYLRHMLVLEDGLRLRLAEGISNVPGPQDVAYSLEHTPTRFGRVDFALETSTGNGTRVRFSLAPSEIKPRSVELPALFADKRLASIEGANFQTPGDRVLVNPEANRWTAVYR